MELDSGPAHPVPALLGVAETANLGHRLVLDDADFVARTMHQNNPQPTNVTGAAPKAAPAVDLLR
jgi:hypothetical protein